MQINLSKSLRDKNSIRTIVTHIGTNCNPMAAKQYGFQSNAPAEIKEKVTHPSAFYEGMEQI